MIALIIIVLLVVGIMGYQKFRGMQALTFTYVDVTGLSLAEVAEVAARASGGLAGRLTGGKPVARRVDDGAEWQVQIQGSVMAFTVTTLPNGSGYRVGGAATKMRIARTTIGSNSGIWGLSKAISNGIYAILGIPHNSPALVSRRRRVLRAVARAGTVLPSAPAAPPAVPPAGAGGYAPVNAPGGWDNQP
jgi:hypothetical protein